MPIRGHPTLLLQPLNLVPEHALKSFLLEHLRSI